MFSEISLHILDILQNSVCSYATVINIHITKQKYSNKMIVIINDNGFGMTKKQLQECCNPFFTTKKNKTTGLGIPFFKYAAELTGGNFIIKSDKNNGTEITAMFYTDSIDCIPLGDIFSTIYSQIVSNPNVCFNWNININDISVNYSSKNIAQKYYEQLSLPASMLYEEIKYLKNELKYLNII